MQFFPLERPLATLDLETTHNDVNIARICEIALVVLYPDGRRCEYQTYVDPEADVHPDAEAVHGLSNEMLREHPPLAKVAPQLLDILYGCDVAGFNVLFDVTVLHNELDRVGWYDWPHQGIRVVDAYLVYKKQHRRNLTAAVQQYLGRELEGAHGALADTNATLDVLIEQYKQHSGEIGTTVNEWHTYCHGPNERVDVQGKLYHTGDGVVRFGFGKHKDEPVKNHWSFAQWMLRQDFPRNTIKRLKEVFSWK